MRGEAEGAEEGREERSGVGCERDGVDCGEVARGEEGLVGEEERTGGSRGGG